MGLCRGHFLFCLGGVGNRTSGNYPYNYIIQNGQNTEKSPGDVGGLAVTQSPVKDHQLKVMRKTLKETNNYKKKNSGDLRRHAVTQTPVKNPQLTLL